MLSQDLEPDAMTLLFSPSNVCHFGLSLQDKPLAESQVWLNLHMI